MSDVDSYNEERARLLARFGKNLRLIRHSKGYSQEQLAYRTRLHRTAIARIERGTAEPRLTTLVLLAEGLDVTVGQLLQDLEVPAERRPSPTGSGSPLA